jgi:hypothetical protein
MYTSQCSILDHERSIVHCPLRTVHCPLRVAAILLAVLALGMPTTAAAQEPAGRNRAGLVIQLGDSQPTTHCIAFDEETITGMDLLERSGLPLAIERSHALGAIVCSIDAQGCAFPGEACFCQCQGTPCHYWNYYYLTDGEWQYGHLGASTRALTDGDVDAWIWGDTRSTRDKLPDIGFEEICSPVAVEAASTGTLSADEVPGGEPPTAGAPTARSTAEGDAPAMSAATGVASTAAPESDAIGPTTVEPTESRAETEPGSTGPPMCSGALALVFTIGSMAAIGLVAARGRPRTERRSGPVKGQRR